MKLIIDQGESGSLTIEGGDLEMMSLLNISALARKHDLPPEVVNKRVSRDWPLVLSLLTEPRNYN